MDITISQSTRYVTMPVAFLEDTELSLKTKAIYAMLYHNKKLLDSLDKAEVEAALNELKEVGYIEVKEKKRKKTTEVILKEKVIHREKSEVLPFLADESSALTYEPSKEEKKKKNKYEKCYDAILDFTDDEELTATLTKYLYMRLNPPADSRLRDKPLSNVAQWKSLLYKLDTFKGNKVEIVNKSIQNEWATFVGELKTDDVHSNTYSRDEKIAAFNRAVSVEKEGGIGIF